MKRVGIVYLITEKPEARGVLDTPTETRRKTYCEEKRLSMSEVYQARASGFAPTIRLVLPQEFEYRGETVCEYKGERYSIIRDYTDEKTGDGRELTLERIRGNASNETAPEPEPDEPDEPEEPEDPSQAQDDTGGENPPQGQNDAATGEEGGP